MHAGIGKIIAAVPVFMDVKPQKMRAVHRGNRQGRHFYFNYNAFCGRVMIKIGVAKNVRIRGAAFNLGVGIRIVVLGE